METYSSLHSTLQGRMYGDCLPGKIYRSARGSKYIVQCLEQSARLTGHQGCVNTISWNDSGDLLLSGSDDCHLNIYRPTSRKLLKSLKSGHGANIFSAKFLPCSGDKRIVSCAGDGKIHFADLDRESMIGQFPFNCHSGTTYEVLTTPGDPNTFLTCGEDGTVRLFDLREKTKCLCRDCKEDILIDCGKAVTSISVNPVTPYHLAVGCEDSTVRVFDRRTMSTESQSSRAGSMKFSGMFCQFRPEALVHRSCRVTSLQYSPNGSELLVSYCADYVYLFTLCGKKQTCLSSDGQDRENGYHSNGQRSVPPLKRLRLRGDWSDTGPHARPESEHASPESSLMQRVSEMFTRWLEQSFREGQRRRLRSSSSSRSTSASSASTSVSSSPSYLSGSSSSESGGGAHGEDATRTRSRPEGGVSVRCPAEAESPTEATSLLLGNFRNSELSRTSSQQDSDVSGGDPTGAESSSEFNFGTLPSVSETLCDSEANCISGRQHEEVSVGRPEESGSPMEVNSEAPSSPSKCFHNSIGESTRTQEFRSNRGLNVSYCDSFELVSHTSLAEDKTNRTSCSTVDDSLPTAGHRSKLTCTEGQTSSQNSQVNSSSSFTTKKDSSCPVPDQPNRSRKRTGNNCSHGNSRQEVVCDKDGTQVEAKFDEAPTRAKSRSFCDNVDESDSCDSQMRDGAAVTQGQTDVLGVGSHGDAQESVTRERGADSTAVTQLLSVSAEETRGVARTHGDATSSVDTTTRQSDNERSESLDRKAAATSIQRLYRRHRRMKASDHCDMETPKMTKVYKGHRNARTMIKEANFFGERYVLSGSDCGRIFFWDKHSAEIVMILQGDRHVVNCVQPHPFYPVIASSGIDYDVKIWEPTAHEPAKLLNAEEIVQRNEKMLEESRDTLTVPASFMIRMLASLNRAMPGREHDSDSDSSDD